MNPKGYLPPISPILKVVGNSCNLRCSYCFYSGCQKSSLTLMDEEVLEKIIKNIMEASPRRTKFIWHGGEPLLAGIDYFKKIVKLQQKFIAKDQIVANSIQTNGTLINKKWVDFFKKNNFRVGISLDGPKDLHNKTRIDAAGKGSFTSVMRGIDLLRDANIKVGAIAVINSYTVNYPNRLFDFFYDQKLNWMANKCSALPNDPEEVKLLAVNPLEYAHFLLELFDLWIEKGDKNYKIKTLADFVHALMGQHLTTCKMRGKCHRYITIGVDGNTYPCHAYLNQNHLLGNITSTGIRSLLDNPKVKEYYSGRLKTLELCQNKNCEWINICNGGCMRSWSGKTSLTDINEHQDCESLKLLYESINRKLKSMGYLTINRRQNGC